MLDNQQPYNFDSDKWTMSCMCGVIIRSIYTASGYKVQREIIGGSYNNINLLKICSELTDARILYRHVYNNRNWSVQELGILGTFCRGFNNNRHDTTQQYKTECNYEIPLLVSALSGAVFYVWSKFLAPLRLLQISHHSCTGPAVHGWHNMWLMTREGIQWNLR